MYEYKVVPAPVRAQKVKGLKTTADRFSHALAERINAEAAGGWQFQRCETLSCEERSTLGRTRTSTQTVMIFARPLGALRPDAGGALAAAQDAQARHEALPHPYADHTQDDAQAYDPVPAEGHDAAYDDDRYEPHPEPEPQVYAPDPAPVEAAQPRRGRQEPLFRSSPMTHPDRVGRPEPVLRPRSLPRDDDEG
jgi:hypothetical protein